MPVIELQPDATWGNVVVLLADPRVEHLDLALYQPWGPAARRGLFHPDGVAVAEAIEYAPLPDVSSVGAAGYAATQPLADDPDLWRQAAEDEGPFLYGGRLNSHYGHFLLDSLPRLWPLVREGLRPGERVLIHAAEPLDALLGSSLRTILGALGLQPTALHLPDGPLRARRVRAPAPALRTQALAHPVFAELTRSVGRTVLQGRRLVSNSRPAYLAKTRLARGIRRVENEEAVLEALERAGVEILYPEEMAFADQVALFAEREVILGVTGSAFHNALFSPSVGRLVCLNTGPALNANYRLIDALLGIRPTYLFQEGTTRVEPSLPFVNGFVLPDPAEAAEALLRHMA